MQRNLVVVRLVALHVIFGQDFGVNVHAMQAAAACRGVQRLQSIHCEENTVRALPNGDKSTTSAGLLEAWEVGASLCPSRPACCVAATTWRQRSKSLSRTKPSGIKSNRTYKTANHPFQAATCVAALLPWCSECCHQRVLAARALSCPADAVPSRNAQKGQKTGHTRQRWSPDQ